VPEERSESRGFRIIPSICALLAIALGLLALIGCISRSSGTLFTEDRLHTTVTRYAGLPAQEFFDRVSSDVRQFCEGKWFDDDVCVVGMEVQHTG
jgi:hypothetical protein